MEVSGDRGWGETDVTAESANSVARSRLRPGGLGLPFQEHWAVAPLKASRATAGADEKEREQMGLQPTIRRVGLELAPSAKPATD